MAQAATAFDPDAYLATPDGTEKPFDPDAYLAEGATSSTRPKTRDNVAIGETYLNEQGQPVIKAKYKALDRYAESPSTGEVFGGMGRNIVGGVAHGLGTLVDVATGTSPGEGSYAEKFASPFQGEPTRLDQLDPEQARWHEAATNTLNETMGTGPLAQTIRERVPQAAEAITAVVPFLKAGGSLAARGGARIPPTMAPGEPIAPTAGMRREVPLSASPTESLAAEATGTRGAPYEVPAAGGAPEMPTRPAGAPESLEMPGRTTRAPELQAQAAGPRAAPYTKLEGDAPPKFVEQTPVAHEGRQLPQDQQLQRAQILQKIGLTGEGIRKSAVTGDAKTAATNYQTSKLDTPGGDLMRNVFDNERAAITNYADRLVSETGGTPGLGQTETLQRGQNIVAPLDDIKAHFDDGIRSLYRTAGERARGVPIELGETNGMLSKNKSAFVGTTDGQALYNGVRGRMEELGILDNEGKLAGVTVEQAEQLKQYLNEQWTPKTSRLIRRIKDSVDDDVTKAAGEDIYAQARSLRATRGRILDDPKGIARIMDADGPEGINRAVAIEKIPETISTLPVAQFEHIVKTLRGAPDELQSQSQAALAEIKSHFASRVYEAGAKNAGQWNAPAVTKYLNANSARMKALFTPDELQNFATLNDAGHVLRFDASYPGAAVQKHNLVRTGAAWLVDQGSTVGGATVGSALGPLGSAAGAAIGKGVGTKVTGAMADRASLKAARAQTMNLSDLLQTENAPASKPPKK